MDEPTAALSSVEVDRLFRVIAALRGRGAAIMFISHRLDEVFTICQQVTIMRDGRFVLNAPTGELDVDTVIRAMIGRDLGEMYQKTGTVPGEVVLAVDQLVRENVFYDVSFNVRRGEVVALAGLVGAGRTEVARAIFGIDRRTSGSVRLLGKALPNGEPAAAMAAGIAFVPEDRRQQGLVMDLAIDHNVALASLHRLSRAGFIFRRAERRLAVTWAERLRLQVRPNAGHGIHPVRWQPAEGRAREVARPVAVAADHRRADQGYRRRYQGRGAPNHRRAGRGGDGGADDLVRAAGGAGVADRILVLHEGRLTGEFARADATEDKIIRAATGQVAKAAA